MEVIHTIGRRKTSVARIFISEGKGDITVNKKDIHRIFPYTYITVQSSTAFSLNWNRRCLRY